MQVIHPLCCGIDIHKNIAVACLRHDHGGGLVNKVVKSFGTTTAELLRLLTWLSENSCPVIAMESTGVYWKPVYNILSGTVNIVIGNPRDIRPRPGRKTDKADADWISELLAHGLISPSFIPPSEIRALRDLTRTRVSLVQTRTQAKNRIHKILEDSNIKLGSVATDLFGKSGRLMLQALIRGECDPEQLSNLSKGLLPLVIC